MTLSGEFIRKVDEVDPKLRDVLLCLMDEVDMKTKIIAVERNDFNEMKEVLRHVVEIQNRTEARLEELTGAQAETSQSIRELTKSQQGLMASQDRMDVRMEELAQAQAKTEIRFEKLAETQERMGVRMEELAQAQAKTEIRLEKLAETQERMGIRIEKLTEAQERTEKTVRMLVLNQKTMSVQLGGLSMAVGYGIEDKIMPDLKSFALQKYGIEVMMVDRRNVVYPDGKYDEINLYAEGVRNSRPVFLIGECKAQPGKKDFDRFDKMISRLQSVLRGEIVPFIVGYHYAPEVEAYADSRYSRISRYKTFQISHLGLNEKVG